MVEVGVCEIVRGNTIAEDIAQINTVIIEYWTTDLEQFFKKEEKQEGEK